MINTSTTILVVDDYSDNRMLLATWLRAKGYKVIEARDGKEGVLQANRANPDLILMDLAMPELDGIEATRQLRQRRAHFANTDLCDQRLCHSRRKRRCAGSRLHGSLL